MGEQTAIGFFKRWVRGTALCRIPFYDNFRKLFNILETIEGRNGIKILKPTGNDGFGWTITKDYDKSDLPAGDSTNVALKWSEADLSWKAVLPVEVENDEQSGALGEDDRVVTGMKTGSDGKLLQLITKPLAPSGGIPDGTTTNDLLRWSGTAWVEIGWYEEETLNLITDAGIITRKILVETASKASVESFASADSRLLLAISTGGVVRKSKGYLKA